MSSRGALRLILARGRPPSVAMPARAPRRLLQTSAPPSPPARTLAAVKRKSSFWAPSHSTNFWSPNPAPDPAKNGEGRTPDVPPSPDLTVSVAAPPLPAPSAVTELGEDDEECGPHQKRKQRYLDSLMDKAGELNLHCSILDSNGNWTVEEGSYKKTDLCRAHDLDPRDLRKLDSLTPSLTPTLVPVILTRRTCILISILTFRALIKPDRVIIFEAPGTEESETTREFKRHLQSNIRAGLLPEHERHEYSEHHDHHLELNYEHRALESVLVAAANALESEMDFVRGLVKELLNNLEHDINREYLRQLLHYSRRLAGFQSRAKNVKLAVDELLDSDEDMSAMYLTDRKQGKPRALHDHDQLELLLESFTKQVEEIVSEIDTTVANMQSTQEISELMLDSSRNALLALDVKVSMATLGIGAGALVAGIFGMNLATSLEQTPWAFAVVASMTYLFAFLIYIYGVKLLRKVGHVSLENSNPVASMKAAKLQFLKERAAARAARDKEIQEARDAAEAAAGAAAAAWAQRPIPDYEQRWHLVRRHLKSRISLWDRLFRPHLLRRSLLGLRRPPGAPQGRPIVWTNEPTTTQSHRVPPKVRPLPGHPGGPPLPRERPAAAAAPRPSYPLGSVPHGRRIPPAFVPLMPDLAPSPKVEHLSVPSVPSYDTTRAKAQAQAASSASRRPTPSSPLADASSYRRDN
ncbi:magnesium ion transporter [Vanrija albida]|uniref:Magnesium ion transporter n=1 Tax=Vanrija albida TaxID=181172 RepID=A0ABR3QFP2_9TREE